MLREDFNSITYLKYKTNNNSYQSAPESKDPESNETQDRRNGDDEKRKY